MSTSDQRQMSICYRPISAIKNNQEGEPIQIRVLKKWTPAQQNAEFCYLFVDTHGDAIQATAAMGEKARLDSIIRIQSCYIVDKYISLDQKTYNPAVPHKACLKLGKRATFVPVFNDQIPDHYYNFATFDELKDRATPPKMLTDYIGRVEDTDNPTTRAGTRLKKVVIQDTRENTIEMTFWPDQSSTLPDHVKKGDILAITSAAVTNFEGNYQLESTPATTVTVNPTTADTASYITRLHHIQTSYPIIYSDLISFTPQFQT
ncbi:putative nucleic acid-binding protein [Helianthus annuus]|uniref:Nucleic acid-binding protein n=1 Tax=Helianthus annuus TaxID=4232 RepID=A0A9K3IR74_HELAN|nr:putative nucleic acid-binding protein [Helianthus annuus]